ncbi:hypothetical protein F511_34295 [Dorcoceras hygrometricum]|uniref:Uncharacterized protein n=1 Tax=Dorcoceras hygrometricum TaxID=472368 RepID=A0A2Z7ADL2_9LAMI|nr:hypothetical protein F511_34295 [Dorcoceras hygrometricum]
MSWMFCADLILRADLSRAAQVVSGSVPKQCLKDGFSFQIGSELLCVAEATGGGHLW